MTIEAIYSCDNLGFVMACNKVFSLYTYTHNKKKHHIISKKDDEQVRKKKTVDPSIHLPLVIIIIINKNKISYRTYKRVIFVKKHATNS